MIPLVSYTELSAEAEMSNRLDLSNFAVEEYPVGMPSVVVVQEPTEFGWEKTKDNLPLVDLLNLKPTLFLYLGELVRACYTQGMDIQYIQGALTGAQILGPNVVEMVNQLAIEGGLEYGGFNISRQPKHTDFPQSVCSYCVGWQGNYKRPSEGFNYAYWKLEVV